MNSKNLRFVLPSLAMFALFGRAQEQAPGSRLIYQQSRLSDRRDLVVDVMAQPDETADLSRAESVPMTVTVTVKNISKTEVSFGHYGSDYSRIVEIFHAETLNEVGNWSIPDGGGQMKLMEPGESLRFKVSIPPALLATRKSRLIVGVGYGIRTGENEVFVGEALSEPFRFSTFSGNARYTATTKRQDLGKVGVGGWLVQLARARCYIVKAKESPERQPIGVRQPNLTNPTSAAG